MESSNQIIKICNFCSKPLKPKWDTKSTEFCDKCFSSSAVEYITKRASIDLIEPNLYLGNEETSFVY